MIKMNNYKKHRVPAYEGADIGEDFKYQVDVTDEEDSRYDTLSGFLQCGILGFCGCGDREASLEALLVILQLKQNLSETRDGFEEYWSLLIEYIKGHPEKIIWLLEYFMDKERITEHGGNASGSWVADENLLHALQVWFHEKKEEEASQDSCRNNHGLTINGWRPSELLYANDWATKEVLKIIGNKDAKEK